MDANIKNDYIRIRGLRLSCRIGVSARERRKRQTILADIRLKCDLAKAGKSDRLEDTVDYALIAQKISALAAKGSFCLLETLAERIAEICRADPIITEAGVIVSKQGVLPHVHAVEIEITRKHRRNNSVFQKPKSKI